MEDYKNISDEKKREDNGQEKPGKGYTSNSGEEVSFKSLLQKDTYAHDYRTENNKIREKMDHPSDRFDRLNKPQEGEWASVENKYAETGRFEFTARGNGKINSPDDVAFIFRKLESQAVENAFAVYVNEKKHPFVQWISMGGVTSTVIDSKLFIDAAVRFDAKNIYFVHNHPSGNLNASEADRRAFKKLKDAFEPFNINIHGIIINLNSGKYSIFNQDPGLLDSRDPAFENQSQMDVSVFSFSQRAFLRSPLDTKIRSSKDVAQFLSQQRFTSGEKRGYLLLDTEHKIVGNFFATEREINPSLVEASVLASRHGAGSLIAYTNNVGPDIHFYNELRTKLKRLDINLLDALQVERSQYVKETYKKYISLVDEGILNENQSIYQTINEPVKIDLNLTEKQNNAIGAYSEYLEFGDAIPESGLTDEQYSKIPDVIDDITLSKNDKILLVAGNLDFPVYGTSYRLKENGEINRIALNENLSPITDLVKYKEVKFNHSQSKTNTMEQKNLDYLANQIKYLGLSEDQKENLQKQMEAGEQKFNLTVKQQYDGYPVNYTLHFNKSNESDRYFLNSYDAVMANGRQQTIYLDKGKGFTAKETFNLMQDRAVFKELLNKNDGSTFDAWIKLSDPQDGKKINDSRKIHIYNENYGYDLEQTLAKHPIKELRGEGDKEKLIASLQKGNRQAVTFLMPDGTEERKFIEARPKGRGLNIYNKGENKMFIPHAKKEETAKQANKNPIQKVTPDEKKPVGMRR